MSNDEKVSNQAGYLWVSKQYVRSGVVQKEDKEAPKMLQVHKFETEPARVNCSLGMTINIGNYESIRVDCGVTLPTYKEELAEAQQEAYSIASSELFKRVNEVKSNL